MFVLTDTQYRRCLILMVMLHIVIIAASNYLVQLPFMLLGLHTTWGAFSFPFIFLATDLTVRLFGKAPARAIVMRVMLPALVVSYLVSVVFPRGAFAGLSALGEWNLFVARIALASFAAYVVGQLLDVSVFNRLRRLVWWVAPLCSTVVGNFADTMTFFFTAFYQGPDAFMAANWVEIALVDYASKLAISTLLFLPLYGLLLSWLSRRMVAWTGAVDAAPRAA
ncbi:7-cyano-7-deazaguanine/7-aminomethyl-7-deazaguanine transporter [Vreelandella jeotgali]|uniref:7-cyano-7-deazaguanine/7-aminomethyl-7- deazaguanine transporter n=1 Tax=Vreelandella jeotgali TaxID=553386 RepID=UPI0003481DFF|nr:7-cyano-7-deazaguanine/7-aminomethyl-7-deazaguanine transporter [Halomonas jeotgali]